jgi:hypothetical protein
LFQIQFIDFILPGQETCAIPRRGLRAGNLFAERAIDYSRLINREKLVKKPSFNMNVLQKYIK